MVWCGVGCCGAVRCGAVQCGVPKVLLPKGNGQDGVARGKMQAGRAVCLSVRCVFGVCPLVPAALPRCGGCGSPAVGGGTCACPSRGVLVALPSRRAPFGLRAVALRAGRAAQSTATTTGGLEASAALTSAARSGGLEAGTVPTTDASAVGLVTCGGLCCTYHLCHSTTLPPELLVWKPMLHISLLPACPWRSPRGGGGVGGGGGRTTL